MTVLNFATGRYVPKADTREFQLGALELHALGLRQSEETLVIHCVHQCTLRL